MRRKRPGAPLRWGRTRPADLPACIGGEPPLRFEGTRPCSPHATQAASSTAPRSTSTGPRIEATPGPSSARTSREAGGAQGPGRIPRGRAPPPPATEPDVPVRRRRRDLDPRRRRPAPAIHRERGPRAPGLERVLVCLREPPAATTAPTSSAPGTSDAAGPPSETACPRLGSTCSSRPPGSRG